MEKTILRKDEAIILTSLRVTKSKENTTELGTSKRTRVLEVPQALAATLQGRLEQPSEWTSLSRTVGYTDYSQVPGTPIHMRALMSLIVPQTTRDFSGEVFEVFHCLVEDLEPLPDAENIFYEGCPVCKKKRGPESTCHHEEPVVRFFLAHCSLVSFEGRAQGRVIGQVLQDMLGVAAENCVPDDEGYSNTLATALDTLRGTPYNMKFIIGKVPFGSRNVLELVHASPTLDVATGEATFPSKSWRLVEGDLTGVPPCDMGSIEYQNKFKILRGQPVANVQLLLCIVDSGDEHGVIDKDGDLVRLKRRAICALSGRNVIVSRTGDLNSINKYLRWERGTVIFAVVRLLDCINDVPHLSIKGSRRFMDNKTAHVFNAYFSRYCELAANALAQQPLTMETSWTPKRRRQELSDDGESQSSLTPLVFAATPLKFMSP